MPLTMDDKNLGVNELEEKGHLGAEVGQSSEIGIFKEGLRVHPEPTADPLDPLNWPRWRKHGILAIVMYL